MKLVTIFFFLALILSCSGKEEVRNNCDKSREVNENEIYSLIAKHWLENSSSKFKGDTIVIWQQTHSLKDEHPNISLANNPKYSIGKSSEVEEFQQNNQDSILLNNKLTLSDKYQYLSRETKFVKDSLVKDFMKNYPNAAILIGYSRIGFNKENTKAIVYSYNTFDRGSYFELENQNCEWIIKEERALWHH